MGRTVKIIDDDTIEVTYVYTVKKADVEAKKLAITNRPLTEKEIEKVAKIDEQLKEFDVKEVVTK